MAAPSSGFQPRNTPAERRAFFDVQRQLKLVTDTADAAITQAQLDAAIAAALDGTRVNLTAQTGWTVPSPGWPARATRVGRLVVIEMVCMNNTAGNLVNSVATILPVGYRPTAGSVRGPMVIQASTAALVQILTDGTIAVVGTVPASNHCYVSITFNAAP